MQTKRQALIESTVNTITGWIVGIVAGQLIVFPLFGLHATWLQQAEIGAAFMVFSMARNYFVRRWFT